MCGGGHSEEGVGTAVVTTRCGGVVGALPRVVGGHSLRTRDYSPEKVQEEHSPEG